jgi:hypothetical protein
MLGEGLPMRDGTTFLFFLLLLLRSPGAAQGRSSARACSNAIVCSAEPFSEAGRLGALCRASMGHLWHVSKFTLPKNGV